MASSISGGVDQQLQHLLEDAQRNFDKIVSDKERSFSEIERLHKIESQAALEKIKSETQKDVDEKVDRVTKEAEQRIELGRSRSTISASIAILAVVGAVSFVAYNSYKDILSLQNQISKDMIALQKEVYATQDRIRLVKTDLDKELEGIRVAKESVLASKASAEIDLAAIRGARRDGEGAVTDAKAARDAALQMKDSAQSELTTIQKIREELHNVLPQLIAEREKLQAALKSAEERLAAIAASQNAIGQLQKEALQGKDATLADAAFTADARKQVTEATAALKKDQEALAGLLAQTRREAQEITNLRQELEKKPVTPQ